MRKIMKENEKLKRLLAEKELENAMLSDGSKKDGEEIMSNGNEYIDRGIRVSKIANILHIPRCRFYKSKSSEGHSMRKGRKNSSFTMRKDCDTAVVVENRIIVNEIEVFLSKEFVCYGYKKMSKQLNSLGYIINGNKVRRLISENNLLNHSYNGRRTVTRVVPSVVDVITKGSGVGIRHKVCLDSWRIRECISSCHDRLLQHGDCWPLHWMPLHRKRC